VWLWQVGGVARTNAAGPVKTLAPMTIRKRLQFAKMIFRAAARHELIDRDPFTDVNLKATMPDRQRFVTPAETTRLLEHCPNQDWRLIVALARWGGMRCPSEVLSLTWADIDWNGRIRVTSPKTAHHPGKDFRLMPLFPELAVVLREVWTPDSQGYVVNERYRQTANGPQGWRNVNLRTSFEKIIKRAGLTPWPRLFHNLRSSRQTELQEHFPTHVVCAWLGNSPDVAREHYLQITDAHFEKANSALHNPVQFGAEMPRHTSQQARQPLATTENCEGLRYYTNVQADGEGFEPTVDFRPRRFSRPVP
jgi:integrase